MEYSFKDEIEQYIAHLDSIEISMPLIILTLDMISKRSKKEYKDMVAGLEEEIDKDGTEYYKVPIENYRKYDRLKNRLNSLKIASDVIPRSMIVSLVSQYDAYLGRLIRTMFAYKPEMLNASQKNITLSDLLTYDSIESAKEMVIEKEIEGVLRDSHSDQFDWLEKKLDISLRKGLNIWSDFIEITERRNLFVHSDGVISSQYLNVCNKHNVKFDDERRIGDTLNVNGKYYEISLDCFYELGIKLGTVIWRKLAPTEVEESDKLYNKVVYDFLVKKDYNVAINLLEFAVNTLKKTANDEYKYLFVINLAQAYKWNGEEEKCEKLITSYDWSPLSYSFKLSSAVLRDNYNEATQYMKRIGNNGEVSKSDYLEWPIFKKFRKSEEFKEVYEEIFNEPVEFHKEVEDTIEVEAEAEAEAETETQVTK